MCHEIAISLKDDDPSWIKICELKKRSGIPYSFTLRHALSNYLGLTVEESKDV
jgi:hypothetical protein